MCKLLLLLGLPLQCAISGRFTAGPATDRGGVDRWLSDELEPISAWAGVCVVGTACEDYNADFDCPYQEFASAEDLSEFAELVASNDGSALVTLVNDVKGVSVNWLRGSVQVKGCAGGIIANLPLRATQLAVLLADRDR